MLVKGKTAVITGAASGIGRTTAETYAEQGANVVVADVDREGGKKTVEGIEEAGGDATFVETDVSVAADVESMILTALETFGGIDVLFNNAGIEGPLCEFDSYEEDAFDRVVSINLKGVFLGMKYGTQAMLEDGGGAIINTSSVAADAGVIGRGAYAGTKSGVNGMTRVGAIEYATDNIRVNAVLPGIIETPMHERAADQKPADRLSRYAVSESMPGKGGPEDIANAVLFLGSDLAKRITGVTLPVDGGLLQQP
ncbi:SDR family NAD(P)-dependent oxidoreductase [Natrialbaceae archaeon A-CW2]